MVDGQAILEQFDIPALLSAATRKYNPFGYLYQKGVQPFVLGHFSDIHGNRRALEHMVAIKQALGERADDFICTGDLVPARYINGVAFWQETAGAENILFTVGNHDVLAPETGFDFSKRVSEEETFSQFFAPFIAAWGVTQPAEKTYYYKDYPEKGVRLIALNALLTGDAHATQLAWFREVLETAKEQGLTVVGAIHCGAINAPIACNFTARDFQASDALLQSDYTLAVADFMDAGGKFACWLGGHTHLDAIGFIRPRRRENRQLLVLVDAAHTSQSDGYSDMPRQTDTASEDVLNLTVIDTASHLLKILRVGANRDRWLRSRKLITIDYASGEVIYTE